MKAAPILIACTAIMALTACGKSNADAAKAESTEKYCSCTADYVIGHMDKDEVALLGRVASTDKNISDKELADKLGMSVYEMQSKLGRAQSSASSHIVSAARECLQYLK